MKLKKCKLKRFRSNAGFTLVELIVVIAILAILGGVAVPAYSGYVRKANIAADQQLISDVANALQLFYYKNTGNSTEGYVVLSKDSGPQVHGAAEAAMNASFGEGSWSELKLKDDRWDAKIISEAANNPYAGSIPDSVYIVDIGTEKVLGDVQNCATSFSQFLSVFNDGDTVGAVDALKNRLGEDVVDGILADSGYTSENNYSGITSDVLANATVFGVADNVKNNRDAIVAQFANGQILSSNLSVDDDLIKVANWYAAGEAFVAYLNDSECTQYFEEIDMSGDAASIVASMRNAYSAIEARIVSAGLVEKQQKYYTPTGGKSQAQLDGEAYVGVLSTVNNLQDDYTKDKDSMHDNALFTNGAVKNRVDNFVAATEMIKDTDSANLTLLQGLNGSAVVIRLAADGTVTPIAHNQ